MFKTIWQATYTPPAPVVSRPPRQRKSRAAIQRRAYLDFRSSKTAQKVLSAIKASDGITAIDLVEKTQLVGASQYARTLYADGMVAIERIKMTHTKQPVNHYRSAI